MLVARNARSRSFLQADVNLPDVKLPFVEESSGSNSVMRRGIGEWPYRSLFCRIELCHGNAAAGTLDLTNPLNFAFPSEFRSPVSTSFRFGTFFSRIPVRCVVPTAI